MAINKANTLSQIRRSFLDFFESRSHEIISSSPLVPHNDPTLMFTNAGMVQFKNVFAGREDLKNKKSQKISKAATVQKCVRAGGKHNDLENVGYTARHHTFFEMLGNFSFGDYFKEGAILNAWDLLTKTFGLPGEKLLVTVYHTDEEAYKLWKKIANLPDERIIRISSDDNFWAMGDTGPCGPCSEIFYDHGDKIAGGPPGSKDQDGDRFIEIWNLVFMQFEKLSDGKQIDLPKPCIDTGMGLERVTTVMQGIHDNYETDLFKILISASRDATNRDDKESEFSHRIISDHLRSSCFLIADGVLPSNEGRGYVLRRIMRRAMRHCHILDGKNIIMHKLVPTLIHEMGDAYPELKRAENLILNTLENEEKRFRETLGIGLKLLEQETESLKKGDTLNGEIAFKLYDTYGFPFDLTQDILKSRNISVDSDGFSKSMEKQKEQARASWSGSGEKEQASIYLNLASKIQPTEFFGYTTLSGKGTVVAIVSEEKEVSEITVGQKASIIFNQTPFYGESGGQSGDKGVIFSDDIIFEVEDTKKQAGSFHTHIGTLKKGSIKLGHNLNLSVDENRRTGLKRAHSATHILHAVLRKLLGDHVSQKGSLVENDYLRFDFSNNKATTKEELKNIEKECNSVILSNSTSATRILPIKQALEEGAVALFGEKYGDEVRVVSMGENKYSVEFCGGTHVERTGDIGFIKIIKESAIASGVRRVEAFTGVKALEYVNEREDVISSVQEKLKISAEDISNRVEKLLNEKREFEKEISDLKKKLALSSSGSSEPEITKIGDINFIAKTLSGIDSKDLRDLASEYKKKTDNSVVLLINDNEGKASIIATVSENLTSRISAVDIVKKVAEILGGKGGGGKPDFAQGGAASTNGSNTAIEAVKALLK